MLKKVVINSLDAILPERIKNALLHLSFNIARPEFERLAHTYCVGPSMLHGLQTIARRGFKPRTIVDVGAHYGDWSRMAKSIWPDAKLIMIEPNKAQAEGLQRLSSETGGKFYGYLLGATEGQRVPFYQMAEESFSGSSVLNERSSARRTVETRSLKTLDSLLTEFEQPGLLKIDVQGYELEVLRGAAKSIRLFDAVLMEVAIIDINEGAPLIRDVINFMDDLGFIAAEIPEVHRRPLDGALSQIDVLFMRRGMPILNEKRYSI